MRNFLFFVLFFTFFIITALAKENHEYENPADKYKKEKQKAAEPLGINDIPVQALINLFGMDEVKSALSYIDYMMDNPVFAPCDKVANKKGTLHQALTRVQCVMENWDTIAEKLVEEGHMLSALEYVISLMQGYQEKFKKKPF